jgi:hypothetical protein
MCTLEAHKQHELTTTLTEDSRWLLLRDGLSTLETSMARSCL